MRGPEPHCQRQFGPVHHRASRDRRLTTAAEAFVGVRPALQRCRASVATGRANKTLWPASLEQKRRAVRLVGKPRLEFAQRSCPCHWAPPRACRVWLAARLLYIIWDSLRQRDKPRSSLYHLLNSCSCWASISTYTMKIPRPFCAISVSSVKRSHRRFASSRWHPVLTPGAPERHETPTGEPS